MANAVACLKAGADAVKLEGGARVRDLIKRMTEAGIPVLAHVGMTPQSMTAHNNSDNDDWMILFMLLPP